MEIFSGLENFPRIKRPTVLAVGTFDGVHIGHQSIVKEVMKRAKEAGSPSAVLTFEPHPQRFLMKDSPPPLISPSREKAELLSEMGLDRLFILHFDRKLASMEPEVFVEQILKKRLMVSRVVVGFSHRFGQRRRGDPSLLRSLGLKLGFSVTVVEPVLIEGAVVNSTRIREILKKGQVRTARLLLGRYYSLSGKVSFGEKRGAVLSYPTANIEVEPLGKLIPKEGVYAVSAALNGDRLGAMMNIGFRPTFGEGPLTVEVHLFDFEGNLYGKSIKVDFVERIRDELRFGSKEDLRLRIEQDEERAREILSGTLP